MGAMVKATMDFFNFLGHPYLLRFLNRTRIFLGGGFILFLLYHADPEKSLFWYALLFTFAGESIQIWAASSLEKNRVFSPRGPYSLVRNPMYFGRFFVLGGLLLLDPHIWLLFFYGIAYFLYIKVRVEREEQRLKDLFGKPYQRYLKSVPRFFPNPWRSCRGYGELFFFHWELVIENREHRNFFGLIIFYSIVYWRLYLFHSA